jgi:hypothetical protein
VTNITLVARGEAMIAPRPAGSICSFEQHREPIPYSLVDPKRGPCTRTARLLASRC